MSEFDGRVEKHQGDGTLVYFGYPEAHEDDAERAIHAALKTIEGISAVDLPDKRRLKARIGIATGLVVVSDMVGSRDRAAVGDAPNLSSRLQSLTEPNSIVVDAVTHRLAGDLFEFRDLGLLKLNGLSEPTRAWRVIGAKPVASRFEAQRKRALGPMLGREVEHQTVVRLWQEARAGVGQVALVLADAGIGKSRLAASVIEDVKRQSCTIFRYFCSPYRQGSPLHPCVQQLEHAAGFSPSDALETRFQKLERVLVGASEDDKALIAELLNLPSTGRYSALLLSPQAKRRRTMQALLALLERVAQQMPVLMVFEDAQWSDDTSQELLNLLISRIARMPVLLLVLARPEFRCEWSSQSHVTHFALGPLPAEVSASLVQYIAGSRRLAPKVVNDIVGRTDGIPLFLEEVTQTIVESQERTISVIGDRTDSALSVLLRASLLPRLNRLGRAREILEVAAAIGRDFAADLLTLVAGSNDDLTPMLDRLVGSGLVLRRADSESNYTFKHALIRDAAYEIMGRERRRLLHVKIAQALDAHFPDTVANHPEILAWHYTEGRTVEKAVDYWLKAGRQALRRSAMGEALNHLRRGADLIATTQESPWRLQNELALMISIGMAQIATQGYAVASTGETFAKARALCDCLGDPPPLLAVLHGLWTHALLRGEFQSAQDQAEQILSRGESRDDPMWRLMGHRFSGVTHHPLGEFSDATRHLELGLKLYDPAQRATYAAMTVDDPRVVMLTYLSWSLMCTGKLADAISRSNEAIAEARQMAHIYTLAHALNGAAFVALTINSPQAGLKRLDELSAVMTDNGIAYYEAVQTIFRGWCLAAIGEFDQALPLLERGMSDYRATESVLYLSGFLRMSAEAHGRAKRLHDSIHLIEEAISIMHATNQRWDEAEIYRVHGTLLQASGDTSAAESAFRRACAVARKQGAKLWELRACCDLAALLVSHDSRLDAVAPLQSIVASFDEALDLPDLRHARTLLERFESPNRIRLV